MEASIGMTLAVEKHGYHLWLVRVNPNAPPTLLARFTGKVEAEAYKAEMARSMAFAREVGRSGLG